MCFWCHDVSLSSQKLSLVLQIFAFLFFSIQSKMFLGIPSTFSKIVFDIHEFLINGFAAFQFTVFTNKVCIRPAFCLMVFNWKRNFRKMKLWTKFSTLAQNFSKLKLLFLHFPLKLKREKENNYYLKAKLQKLSKKSKHHYLVAFN